MPEARKPLFDKSDWRKRKPRYDVAEARMGRVFVIRLAPGDDLFGSVLQICADRGVKAGVILSAAASLKKAVLRNVWKYPEPSFPITDACRIFTPVRGPLELLQMSGNITQTEAGESYMHAHVTISLGRPEGTCFGGHLVEGCEIFSTAEIAVAELEDVAMMRLPDRHTRTGEVYAITVGKKSKAQVRKLAEKRKARPKPRGVA